jgi:excisionase family DNA binding protein
MPVTIQGITFYTVQETAKELRVTAQTIRTYVKQNKLKGKRIGLPLYITEDNIREFLTSEDKPVESNTQKAIEKDINKDDEMFNQFLKEIEELPKRYARKKK